MTLQVVEQTWIFTGGYFVSGATALTLKVPIATNIKVLLKIIQAMSREKIIAPKRKCFDFLSNSLNYFFKEISEYQSVWRIGMWILGLKRLTLQLFAFVFFINLPFYRT